MSKLEELFMVMSYFGADRGTADHDMEDFMQRAEAAILNYGESLISSLPQELVVEFSDTIDYSTFRGE